MLSKWPRGLLLIFAFLRCISYGAQKSEESGEMYLPDDHREYMPKVGTLSFSIQGPSDALTALETMTEVQTLSKEFSLQLKVMMADCPGHPCVPVFSCNAGMALHVLKSTPILRDLEHIQVDGPGTAYLFFFDKQGHW